ncbi:MAG TPA: hypothetical protein VHU82_02775, partial [Vicinamibacterales bacterium]|nr:hypothetical protein [Vicinamibacterales bacterium]
MDHHRGRIYLLCLVGLLAGRPACAAPPDDPPPQAQTSAPADAMPLWSTSFDGQLFATFNRQGGTRGDTGVRSQNWLMGMASRPLGAGTLTLSGMVTGEPLTVGAAGYSEIFQEGESYHGR